MSGNVSLATIDLPLGRLQRAHLTPQHPLHPSKRFFSSPLCACVSSFLRRFF